MPMHTTQGTLLGGRVHYQQPVEGFRSGIEPILLAAAIPARPGQRVLEAGSGAGAALLCLATRVPGVMGLGVEIDPALAAMATANAAANQQPGIVFAAGDILRMEGLGLFDHACANPPYHPPSGTPSSVAGRARAKIAPTGLFAAWIAALARHLHPKGTLSLILPAGAVPECMQALAVAGCGSPCLLPLWPRADRPAKLVLLAAKRGGRAPFQVLPGLVLHDAGGFTPAAEAIFRHACPLDSALFGIRMAQMP